MRRVLLVEPDLDGHHAFWLALIIEAHLRAGWAAEVLTSRAPERLWAQVRARGLDPTGFGLHALDREDPAGCVAEAFARGAASGVDRVFFAFLDRLWKPLLDRANRGEAGPGWAGIWFHPHALESVWRWAPPLGKRWALRGRIHRFLRGARAGRAPEALWVLDEDARRWLGAVRASIPGHVLPDPFEREPRLDRAAARRVLGLPADRVIFLHLGSAEPRKGLPDTLGAFVEVIGGEAGAKPARPLLLRVGPNDRLAASDRELLARLEGGGWALKVETFVPAEELMEYFSASDWVLLPYHKFRFSSGILANAIGAVRPVIAADYGRIGRDVARGRLGLLHLHGSRASLAAAVRAAMAEPGVAAGFTEGLNSARDSRTVERMVSTLARSLVSESGARP